MSGATTAAWVGAAIAGASAVASYSQGQQQQAAAKKAQRQQQVQAQAQAEQAERDFRRQNQKAPDLAAIIEANATASQAGSTMLTGPGGAAVDQSLLGRSTLLGG